MTDQNIQIHTNPSISELLAQLSRDQVRFVAARVGSSSDKQAAERVGINYNTVRNWSNKAQVDEVVRLSVLDTLVSAQEVLKLYVVKAAMVKVTALDSTDEKVKQDAASEVLDRNLGKATQRSEHTGRDGGPVIIERILVVEPNGSTGDKTE